MKRFLLWFGGLLLLLILFLAAAPFLFKDQIKAKIDAEIANSITAKVYYDADKVGLSFFSHFPNLTVVLGQFGVVGVAEFEGDTLAHVARFGTTINLGSLLAGGKLKIASIELESPKIRAIRLPNGLANWEITKPDTTAPTPKPTEPTQFALQIDHWAITDGDIAYIDAQAPMAVAIKGLQHSGKGDFTQDILDLTTETTAEAFSVRMDSTNYLTNKKVALVLTAEINQKEQKYTLKKSELRLNDMGMAVDGWMQLQGKAIATDITYKSLNGNFKDLLSLVPGVYTKSFDGLKADGTFTLSGLVKGTYKDSLLPRFVLNLAVQQGQFQYPNLPSAVTGIGVDMTIDHAPGTWANTGIHLKKFEMKMGKNPIAARADIAGLQDMVLDANIKAKLNLTEISNAFPMDGLALKGLLSIDATAKGVYSQARKRLPAVSASLNLLDGYVKSSHFPTPIEALTVQAFVENGTGRMEDTHIRIPAMSLLLDGQPFAASAQLDDLVNYRWDIAARGTLDLAKMTKIYPIEGTTVAGLLKADIKTRGTMADVTAKHYDRLPTSGTLDLTGLVYKTTDLAQGITASAASVRFSPTAIQLLNFDGAAGKSALKMSGSLQNYFGYMLGGQTLKGKLDIESPDFDINPWMAPTSPAPASTPEPPMEAVLVPRNLDLAMQARFGKLLYSNMAMRDVAGRILVRDGIVNLNGLRMQALGGLVKIDGTYDSQDAANPGYDMAFDMKDVGITELYTTFSTVRALAPVAKSMTGKISTTMRLMGKLNGKMEPVFSTLQGGGMALVADAQVKDLKAVSGLNQVAKLNLPTETALHNLRVFGDIANGRLNFKPFDVNLGGQKLTFAGSNGLDQTIDWKLNTLLPASAVGQAATAIPALAAVQGLNQAVPLNFNITGSHTSPKVSFNGLGKTSIASGMKDRAKAEADKLKQQAEQRARDEAAKLLEGQNAERLKQEAADKAKQELEKLKKKFRF